MRRPVIFGIVLGLLLIVTIYRYWEDYGLITIHAHNRPLFEVMKQIEKQGHTTVRVNFDGTTLVTMDVDHVNLPEAMEVLSIATESRWKLTYFAGPNRSAVNDGIDTWTADKASDDWRLIQYSVPPFLMPMVDAPAPDSRKFIWTPTVVDAPDVAVYLNQIARSADAAFYIPKDWSPKVAVLTKPLTVDKGVKKVMSEASASYKPVFTLSKFGHRFGGEPLDEATIDNRIDQYVQALPPEARADAQTQWQEQKQLRQEMQALPPDQRRARMQQYFNNPAVQERIEEMQARRDASRTPEQREARDRNYIQQKAAIKAGR